jgi:hypothetical protein
VEYGSFGRSSPNRKNNKTDKWHADKQLKWQSL